MLPYVSRRTALALALPLTAASLLLAPAQAQTIVSGNYAGLSNGAYSGAGGNGYNATAGQYIVTGGTFTGGSGGPGIFDPANSNVAAAGQGGSGLSAANTGTTVTINAGSFTGGSGGQGGIMPGAPGYAVSSSAGSSVTIKGGTFTGGPNPFAFGSPGTALFASGGTITLIGTFAGLSGPQTATSGVITGTLANNSTPGTYSYSTSNGGSLILAAAPEPSALAAFGVGLLGLGTLSFAARRRVCA